MKMLLRLGLVPIIVLFVALILGGPPFAALAAVALILAAAILRRNSAFTVPAMSDPGRWRSSRRLSSARSIFRSVGVLLDKIWVAVMTLVVGRTATI